MVCGGCSTKKFLLPSQSNKPVRVCDACYDQLSSARGRLDQSGGKYYALPLRGWRVVRISLQPSQSSKPVRVCDACYDQLSSAKGKLDQSGGKY